jgi:hypothetical protein
MRSRATLALILTLAGGLATESSSAASEDGDMPSSIYDSKFTMALGGFFPRIKSSLTLSSPGGRGTEISAEDDLGLESGTNSAWVSFNWRFQPRHTFHVEWFQLNRKGSSTAHRSRTIFGTTIGVGASTSSSIEFNLGRVTYGYSILRDKKFDLSIMAGVHVATVKATVTASGNVSVDGIPLRGKSHTDSTSTYTFPLPHIGGSMAYKFTPKLSGRLMLIGFALDLGDYSGHLIESDATIAYQLSKHFGIGGGLKYFNLNLQANTSNGGHAEYDYQFFGPAIFGYTTF